MGAARGRAERDDPGADRPGEEGILREAEEIDRRIAALMAEAARLRRALRKLVRRDRGS